MKKFMGTLLASALILAGCGGAKEPPPAAAPGTTAAAGAGRTSVVPAAQTAAAGEFGVPECDTYMQKYRACLDKHVPEAVKPAMKQSFDQTAAAWRQAAQTPQGRDGLKMACAQAETMAKQAMAPYGCTW